MYNWVKTYCLRCKEHAENKNVKVLNALDDRVMFSAHATLCDINKNEFNKNELDY